MTQVMNDTDNSSPAPFTALAVLLALLLMGAGVGGFLWRQVTQIHLQVMQARQVVADYQTNTLPKIKVFVASLQTFSKTNPDFAPILAKYNLLSAQLNHPSPATGAPQK
jgi:hypothetical protein